MRCRNNIPPLSALAFAIGLHSRLDVVGQCVGMPVDVLKQVLTSFLLSSCPGRATTRPIMMIHCSAVEIARAPQDVVSCAPHAETSIFRERERKRKRGKQNKLHSP